MLGKSGTHGRAAAKPVVGWEPGLAFVFAQRTTVTACQVERRRVKGVKVGALNQALKKGEKFIIPALRHFLYISSIS